MHLLEIVAWRRVSKLQQIRLLSLDGYEWLACDVTAADGAEGSRFIICTLATIRAGKSDIVRTGVMVRVQQLSHSATALPGLHPAIKLCRLICQRGLLVCCIARQQPWVRIVIENFAFVTTFNISSDSDVIDVGTSAWIRRQLLFRLRISSCANVWHIFSD